ncbi:hypothetical protein [Lysobacter gummosus]
MPYPFTTRLQSRLSNGSAGIRVPEVSDFCICNIFSRTSRNDPRHPPR